MLDVQSYLNNQHLRKLFNKTDALTQLNQNLRSTIPHTISDFCQIANYTESTVIVGCASASLMLEAKRYETHFLNLIQKYQSQCFEIKWKIMPSLMHSTPEKKIKRTLSKQAQTTIKLTAQYIRDEELKASLQRLASIESD